jgi:integrase
VPQKEGPAVAAKNLSLRALIKKADLTPEDGDWIAAELVRQGVIRSFTSNRSEGGKDFCDYLEGFWDYETSDYIKEKNRKDHGVHKNYCQSQRLSVQRYWTPFFEGKALGEITRRDIEGFVDGLKGIKRRELAGGSKNRIILAGTIALKWAFSKGLIDHDPTAGLVWFSTKPQKRNILTPELAQALFSNSWTDNRVKMANLLSAVTGLRAGEVLALRVKDLGRDCLYISSSWNVRDRLKTTKTNEERVVQLPYPGVVDLLMNLAKDNPHGHGLETFIFWAVKSPEKPMEHSLLNRGLRLALQNLGLGEAAAAGYSFHGWRHFFTSFMIDKLSDRLLKSQTGHKTDSMLRHYSDHAIETDKAAIQEAQLAVFGRLIPVAPEGGDRFMAGGLALSGCPENAPG